MFFIIVFDGYDLVVFGTVVAELQQDWGISAVEAGLLSSYGLFGMTFGAMFLGILADKLGRKNITVIAVLLFSVFTFLCGVTNDPTVFAVYRFLAGLGLGGIMPNIIALLTDYSPKKMRSMVVSIVLCGYSVGGMLAPILGIVMMPHFGWESIFYVAGIPVLLLPIMYKMMPESAVFLARKGKKKELFKILALLIFNVDYWIKIRETLLNWVSLIFESSNALFKMD